MRGVKYFSEPLRFVRERPLLCIVGVGSIIVPVVYLYRRYCREHALSTDSSDGAEVNCDFENVLAIEGRDCEMLLPKLRPLSGPVVPYLPVGCPASSPRFETVSNRDCSTGHPAPLAVLPGGHRGRPLTSSKGVQTVREALVRVADMSEDMQQDAVVCATQAMEKHMTDRDIAAYVKKEFDRKYDSRWHCVVGRNYGSFVTHETKHFIYFYLGQKAILLFKCG